MSETQRSLGKLVLPAFRARMGDWIYYISLMTMKDITERISRMQLAYESIPLQELLQRRLLSGRKKDIRTYLISQPQRFFNALVVGTSGGTPKWIELSVREGKIPMGVTLPKDVDAAQGFLVLDGSERLFTIDGQHRVEGIRQAIEQKPELENEQVCVVLLKGVTGAHRADDPEGFERTRRLFSTLNRYAKPVGTKDIIALDEDDVAAIVTRKLVEEYDLFQGTKISIKENRSVSSADRTSVTSIVVLYQALDFYLGGIAGFEKREWTEFKKFRPSEEVVKHYYDRAVGLWNRYCDSFPPLREAKESPDTAQVASKYRHKDGGHLLFRPIGLLMSVKTLKRLEVFGKMTQLQAINRLKKIPVDIAKAPWENLIWDPVNGRMLAAVENQRAAEKRYYFGAGGNLSDMRSTPEDLKFELAGLLKVDSSQVDLRQYSE